jgi:cytochrome c oxidase cbb3-type subunit 3
MLLYKRNILLFLSLIAGGISFGHDAVTAVPAPGAASDNSMLYLLEAGAAILLMAILLLGNVLVTLTRMAFEKRKALSVILLLFAVNVLFAQDAKPAAAAASEPSLHQMFSNIDLVAGVTVVSTELLVLMWMLFRIRALLFELSGEKKKVWNFNFHMPHVFDNINASVAIEKEKDILLDHNYDGIRELDNSLPPWWKYSFYLSIIWAVCYLGYYYIGGGPSSIDEYKAEVEQAAIDVEAYNKKNALNVDESHVELANVAGIAEGQDIFKTNCAACHGNAGEGVVGPNLTDNYWIHGGSLNELFKTVKYGWPAKGMKSWEADLSAVQIKNVISYIHSIRGTNPPNAKAPQGDLFTESASSGPDSTLVAHSDSATKKL